MADREIRYLFRKKQDSGCTLPYNAMIGEPFVNTYEGRMFFSGNSGGSYIPVCGQTNVFEVGSNVDFVYAKSGITTSQLNAGIILSAGTDLYQIFSGGSGSVSGGGYPIQPGLNIYTGGTYSSQTVNVSGLTIDNINVSGNSYFNVLSAITINGGIIMSAGTDLYQIFSGGSGGGGFQYWTAGTSGNQSIRQNNDSGIDAIGDYAIASGFRTSGSGYSSFACNNSTLASGNTSFAAGYNTIAAGTESFATGEATKAIGDYSFSQGELTEANGQSSFAGGYYNIANANQSVIIGGQNNIVNAAAIGAGIGAGNAITATTPYTWYSTNMSVINSLGVGGNMSATTIISGKTNLYDIFLTITGNDITRIQPGSNISTGGSENAPVINLAASPYVNDFTASGNTSLGVVSATTIISGNTNLYDIFQTTADGNDITRVQPGFNIFTAGTENAPTINFTSATIDNLTVSGTSTLDGTTASSLSANSITSTTSYVTSLYNSSERIVTISGSSLLQDYLQTDTEFITNSTVISNIINISNWLYNSYTGSTTGLIEGQKYQCCNYFYVYSNSTLFRYPNGNPSITTYTEYTSASTTTSVVFCNSATDFTIMMPPANNLVLGGCQVKNIGTGIVTISATTSTFDAETYQNISQWECIELKTYLNNYYIT